LNGIYDGDYNFTRSLRGKHPSDSLQRRTQQLAPVEDQDQGDWYEEKVG
jgi:hypothetical protein